MVSLMGNKPKIDEPSPWIQIAGHMDCFVPFENNRKVAKAIKEDRSEYNNYVLIDENDALFAFLPPFHGLLEEKIKLQIDSAIHKHDEWLVLSNVLTGYIEPVVMDVKMGKETCGAKQYHVKMTKRRDLFEKFCDLEFPLELLSEDEIRDQAVSKFRYAELRDKISTTSQYGFRIEASNLGKVTAIMISKSLREVSHATNVLEVIIEIFINPYIILIDATKVQYF